MSAVYYKVLKKFLPNIPETLWSSKPLAKTKVNE